MSADEVGPDVSTPDEIEARAGEQIARAQTRADLVHHLAGIEADIAYNSMLAVAARLRLRQHDDTTTSYPPYDH